MVDVCIPEYVIHGTKLLHSATVAKLESQNRVRMSTGEHLIYFYCNSAVQMFLRDETEACVLLTNQRLVAIDNDMVLCNMPLDEVLQASHRPAIVRCDKMLLTRRNGEQLVLSIYRREVAIFLVTVVNRLVKQRLSATATPKSMSRTTRCLSPTSASKPSGDMEQDLSCVIDELLRTEERYSNQLQSFNRLVIEPLRSNRVSAIKKDAAESMFASLIPITKYHEIFYTDLQAEFSLEHIAKMFIRHGPFFKIYVSYLTNFATCEKTVVESKRKVPAFCAFLEHKKQEMGGVSVEDIMISPIQRLPRYVLFLEELGALCGKEGPDSDLVSQATEVMRGTVSHINECQKSLDLQQSLVAKQARLVGSPRKSLLLQPQRKFIREGPLRLSKKGSPEAFTFYLFSDALVWTTLEHVFQEERLLVAMRFPMESRPLETDIQPDLVIVLELANQECDFDEFTILELICGSAAEKEEWEGPLRAAIDVAWKRRAENDANRCNAKRKRDEADQGPRRISLRPRASGPAPVERTLDFSSAKLFKDPSSSPLSLPPLPLSFSSPPLPPAYDQFSPSSSPSSSSLSSSALPSSPSSLSLDPTSSSSSPPSPSSAASLSPDNVPVAPLLEQQPERKSLLDEIRGGMSLKKTPARDGLQAPRVILKAKRHSTAVVPQPVPPLASSLAETLAGAIEARRKTLAAENNEESPSDDWD